MPQQSDYDTLLAKYTELTKRVLEVRRLQKAYFSTRGKNPDAAKEILQKSKDAERQLDGFLAEQQQAENAQQQLF